MCKDELKEHLKQKIAYYKKQSHYYTVIEYNQIHKLCCDIRIRCYGELISTLDDFCQKGSHVEKK